MTQQQTLGGLKIKSAHGGPAERLAAQNHKWVDNFSSEKKDT
jgi:hypothetical protein